MRLEIAILVAAVVIQLFYSKIYDQLISTTTKGTAHLEPRTEIIEVSEFHSPACEGPPARVWLIRPPRQESGEDTPCISIRPEMKIPGKSDAATAGEQLYGRVSCATLRHEDGGFLDLCVLVEWWFTVFWIVSLYLVELLVCFVSQCDCNSSRQCHL